jgi:hypothetical protein
MFYNNNHCRIIITDFPAVAASKHSVALPKIHTSPRTLWPALKPWFVPHPTTRRQTPRNKLDARFTKALNDLNQMDGLHFAQNMLRKLRAWYALFPLTSRVGGGTAGDAAEEGTGGAAPEDGGEDGAEDKGGEAPYAFSYAE